MSKDTFQVNYFVYRSGLHEQIQLTSINPVNIKTQFPKAVDQFALFTVRSAMFVSC